MYCTKKNNPSSSVQHRHQSKQPVFSFGEWMLRVWRTSKPWDWIDSLGHKGKRPQCLDGSDVGGNVSADKRNLSSNLVLVGFSVQTGPERIFFKYFFAAMTCCQYAVCSTFQAGKTMNKFEYPDSVWSAKWCWTCLSYFCWMFNFGQQRHAVARAAARSRNAPLLMTFPVACHPIRFHSCDSCFSFTLQILSS